MRNRFLFILGALLTICMVYTLWSCVATECPAGTVYSPRLGFCVSGVRP